MLSGRPQMEHWLSMGYIHCVKSVQIVVFSGPYFPAFGLNWTEYFVSHRIQSECWKIRTRKNYVSGHFSHSDFIPFKSKFDAIM